MSSLTAGRRHLAVFHLDLWSMLVQVLVQAQVNHRRRKKTESAEIQISGAFDPRPMFSTV